jgi:hypothetical protein
MVKLQCFHTAVVPASLATRALVNQGLLSNDFPAPADGINQIAATIRVCTSLCHQFPHSYSRLLYQLSYRGT